VKVGDLVKTNYKGKVGIITKIMGRYRKKEAEVYYANGFFIHKVAPSWRLKEIFKTIRSIGWWLFLSISVGCYFMKNHYDSKLLEMTQTQVKLKRKARKYSRLYRDEMAWNALRKKWAREHRAKILEKRKQLKVINEKR
jgi:hypothetical protein